jgi:hypothetical protein
VPKDKKGNVDLVELCDLDWDGRVCMGCREELRKSNEDMNEYMDDDRERGAEEEEDWL